MTSAAWEAIGLNFYHRSMGFTCMHSVVDPCVSSWMSVLAETFSSYQKCFTCVTCITQFNVVIVISLVFLTVTPLDARPVN